MCCLEPQPPQVLPNLIEAFSSSSRFSRLPLSLFALPRVFFGRLFRDTCVRSLRLTGTQVFHFGVLFMESFGRVSSRTNPPRSATARPGVAVADGSDTPEPDAALPAPAAPAAPAAPGPTVLQLRFNGTEVGDCETWGWKDLLGQAVERGQRDCC